MIEGGKGDVEEYMRLIRTEFFETLNPRGRKITVRLEEELPEDEHTEKFEYVQAKKRSELPADETLKGAELERFLDSKRKDETCVKEVRHCTDKTANICQICLVHFKLTATYF